MRDDPRKRFKDGSTVSWQAQEMDYIQPSEGREKLIACIREKLQ